MIHSPDDRNEVPAEAVVNTIWVSTILALILILPSLGVFLGIYYSTGNVVAGAIPGFGLHFVTLAFSGRISAFLTRMMS